MVTTLILVAVGSLFLGVSLGFLVRRYLSELKIGGAKTQAKEILELAKKEAEAKKKEAIFEAKDQIHRFREQAEKENRTTRFELQNLEKRLVQREEALANRLETLETKEKSYAVQTERLTKKEEELKKIYHQEKERLEKLAGLSLSEARELLLKRVEEDVKQEAAKLVREIEGKAREEGEKKARDIISSAIQRLASDEVAETTVSVVPLPSDELKGRIIGREGRNIRAFEMLTGVNLVVDDTPEAVTLSGFDPLRREIARLTLEKLIMDGRIHPARIEEMYQKSKAEMEAKVKEVGEQAAFEVGIQGLHPELIKVLGRLKYRTSYGQNVLQHSIEEAHLIGIMASELEADVKVAKRAALLHDIGKAVSQEVEGPHAAIGAELARRFKESPEVCQAIEAHHGEAEAKSVEAVLVQATDAISGGRPGARRETLERYIKRLESLEAIADSYKGVEKAYAIQAGREVRVIVKPEEISDEEAVLLAREVAQRVEKEMEYPGQVKVTVIRESRAIEYAK